MATGYSETPIVPATSITIHALDDRPAIVVPPSAATLQGSREGAVSGEFTERGRLTFVAGEVNVDTSYESIGSHLLIPGEKEFQVVPEQADWMASPTFGKSVKLERTLEEDGFPKYTLHMK